MNKILLTTQKDRDYFQYVYPSTPDNYRDQDDNRI